MKTRTTLAILLPFLTCYIQWLLWDEIKPYVWFLFFPTAFFSAWIGGIFGGLAATVICALLVWYVFIPPSFSFALENPSSAFSVVAFVCMGALYVFIFERMRVLMQLTGKQLELSESMFESTFEQAAVGIALVAPDGRWLRVNNKLCEIIGYTHDELLTKTFQDITYPDDLNADLTFVQKMLAGEINSYSMEKRYICKDGSIVWIKLSVALTRNPDGTPDYFISVVESIHKRKQSEAALLETAATLKEAQQLTGIGNWRWDVKNDVHTWSEEIYLIYGRDPSLPPAVYPEVQQYFTPESWANLSAAVEKGLAAGKSYACDAEVVRPDGSHRWITARGEATRDDAGNIINLHGTVQDITKRKQAEAILKASEEKYRTLVETTDTGYLILDMQGKVVDANPEYVRLTGHDALSDILGRSVTEWTASYEVEKNLKAVMQCVKDGFIKDLLIDYVDGNGRITPVEINATVVSDGDMQRIISLIRDISERRRAEQMLRDKEARLAGIINSAMDAVISVDEQQRICLFNPAAAQMFGTNATEAIGQPLENLIPQRFRMAHAGHINNFAQKGITARRMGVLGEISGLRANGEEFPIEASISHTSLEGGKLFTVILRDITERHRAEEEIHQLNSDLERHVEARTAELSAANRELDSFSYAVSHDLRAPLRAMSGFSQALSQDYGNQLQGEAKVYLEQIDIASRKMSDLINGLLVLSRITRGELQNDTVGLSAFSEQFLAELAQSDPQRRVKVQVESGLMVNGDARMIEVVMRNLLENAWKYTAHEVAPSIRVYSEQRDGKRCFCVADNGAGFDMAHANRLFKPFQRLHRQEEFSGIGIGLATVQRIVHRHGGTIDARGEPGKGAVFCFTLADTPEDSEQYKKET